MTRKQKRLAVIGGGVAFLLAAVLLVMFAFSIWAFWSVSSRPRDNLLTALFDSLERGVLGVAGQWRRLRGNPA